MADQKMLDEIGAKMVDINEKQVLELCRKAIDSKVDPIKIVNQLGRSMEAIGKKYEDGEFFLSDLIMSGEIMKGAMDILRPHLKGASTKARGKAIVGTVEGDAHNIGKDLFIVLLQAAGFEVHDLGVDVQVTSFIRAVRELKPEIVAMSSLLTTSMVRMKDVIEALKESSLRQKVKVVIGGAPINKEYGKTIGADGAALDAVEGVDMCKGWFPA